MKKVLFGSTALATAGLVAAGAGEATAAERIQLQVSGYMQQWLVGVDQDFNDGGGQVGPNGAQRLPTTQGFKNSRNNAAFNVDQKTNAEICFVGQTTLDNGITVGVNVQMEAANDTGTNVTDEFFLFVQSERFGQLKVGSEDGAASLLRVTAPNGGISVDDGDVPTLQFFRFVAGDEARNLSTDVDFDSDDNKFVYITPRLYGFQAGVSYTPLGNNNSQNPQSGEEHNSGVSAALNYTNVFSNGLGVRAYGGVLHFNQTCGTGRQTTGGDRDGDCNDLMEWGTGAQASYAGFTVGGSYKQRYGNTGAVRAGTLVTTTAPVAAVPAGPSQNRLINGNTWSVGGAYETGPYTVGVAYTQGKSVGWNIGGTGDTKTRAGTISGTYLLGPGIRLRGGFFLFEAKAEEVPGATNSAANTNTLANRNNRAARNAGIQNTSTTMGWGGALAITASF